jgi:predicted Zn-dependent protease
MKWWKTSGKMKKLSKGFLKISSFLILLLILKNSFADEPYSEIFSTMEKEMKKNLQMLKLKDYEKPYFIAYRLVEVKKFDISAKFGSIIYDEPSNYRIVYVETRYGSYFLDNTSDAGYSGSFNDYEGYSTLAPLDDDLDVLKHRFWLLTEVSYKKAVSDYYNKKARRVIKVQEDEDVPDFSKEKRVVYIGKEKPFTLDRDAWEEKLKRISKIFRNYEDIVDSEVRMSAEQETRFFINSEGTKTFTQNTYYYIKIRASTLSEDGMPLTNFKSYFEIYEEKLPSEEELINSAKEVAEKLLELRKAPEMEPYTGPAILSPEAAGVLFHEVIGHRLEGERQRSPAEGMTFKNKIGEKILPDFLTVIDDPTLKEENGKALSGYYEIDDEGVPAQKVVLVENGILKNFLLSRRPVKGFKNSNGHGRADENSKPMARMGNLIVRSSKTYPVEELEKMLLELLKEKGKEFGFIIDHVEGGETNTSRYGFQAFKGTPVLVYKIYAKDGRKELVRGVDIVGTPLAILDKIIATSDTYGVFNGVCGAESGFIPVSTVAPAILVSEIELQKKSVEKKRGFILKPEWKNRR